MQIAVLGLGIIGEIWARNFYADGIPVRGWNRTPKPELAFFEADPVRAIEYATHIILVVADPKAVQSVIDLILPALQPNQIVLQSSTISPEWTQKIAQQVCAKGARFIDAPFTGSKPAAEQRQTVFYLGGDESDLEAARPVLERIAKAQLRIGPVGAASALKLAMNMNIAMVVQALSESLTFSRASGIPDGVFFDALKLNASRAPVSDLKEPKLRSGEFSPQFSLKHMHKDLHLARETHPALSLAQFERLLEIYQNGMSRGWAEDDFAGLIRSLVFTEKLR